MKKKGQSNNRRRFNLKSNEVPVTQAMLYGVRDELMARLNSHDHRMDSMDKRFDQIDKRFEQVDKRFEQLESRLESFEQRVIAEIRRIGVIVEEQRAQNIYVLDGISNLSHRVENLEDRVLKLEEQQKKNF